MTCSISSAYSTGCSVSMACMHDLCRDTIVLKVPFCLNACVCPFVCTRYLLFSNSSPLALVFPYSCLHPCTFLYHRLAKSYNHLVILLLFNCFKKKFKPLVGMFFCHAPVPDMSFKQRKSVIISFQCVSEIDFLVAMSPLWRMNGPSSVY